MRSYSKEQLWETIRKTYAELGRKPTQHEFYEHTGVHPTTVTRYLGGRWADIWTLAADPMRTSPPETTEVPFEEKARQAIARVREKLGGQTPGTFLYDVNRLPTDPAAVTIRRHFGSWAKALQQLGFPPAEAGPFEQPDEVVLRALAKLWLELGHEPSTTEIREAARGRRDLMDPATYIRRFGSVKRARELARAYLAELKQQDSHHPPR